MTFTVYCYNYNNYYNRIFKKEDSLSGYGVPVYTEEQVNFNFADGINTSQVLNTFLSFDYIILSETNGEAGNINSRWFVIDGTYTRNGQHLFTLRRDAVADYFDEIAGAPMFIDKAILNSTDKLIFNKENLSLNQIKKEQILLKEAGDTNKAYCVGYLANNFLGTPATAIPISANLPIKATTTATLEEIMESNNKFASLSSYFEIEVEIKCGSGTEANVIKYASTSNLDSYRITGISFTDKNCRYNVPNPSEDHRILGNAVHDALVQSHPEEVYSDDIASDTPLVYNGAIARSGVDGKLYNVSVIVSQQNKQLETLGSYTAEFDSSLSNYLSEQDLYINSSQTSTRPKLTLSGFKYTISATLVQPLNVSGTIATTVNKCLDAPYYMFSFPINNEKDLQFAYSLSQEFSGNPGPLYDMQILPYQPPINNPEVIDYDYTEVKDSDNHVWETIYWHTYSSFTKSLPYTYQVNNYKLENETDMWRLCSPNGNGVFEFNAARNGGIYGFRAECTYKPYTPYMNIVPTFSGIYGENFKDYRGLICQGDFSMPLITDQWKAYEINNKNYLNIFNRELFHMEIGNIQGTIQDATNMFITGPLQGAGQGASVGGIYGAVAGAVLGQGMATLDAGFNMWNRLENRNYAKDMFALQIGNIKARPDTLAKTGSIFIDNTYVPYLEYYTCTDEEKEAVALKIAYESMTVSKIGKINDYINNTWSYGDIVSKGYIKGRLIKLELENEDAHIIAEIDSQLNQGIYFGG